MGGNNGAVEAERYEPLFRNSNATPGVRPGMRYLLLLILVALLVFLSNQVWQMFGGTPLF
jgi:hypothetical protein